MTSKKSMYFLNYEMLANLLGVKDFVQIIQPETDAKPYQGRIVINICPVSPNQRP